MPILRQLSQQIGWHMESNTAITIGGVGGKRGVKGRGKWGVVLVVEGEICGLRTPCLNKIQMLLHPQVFALNSIQLFYIKHKQINNFIPLYWYDFTVFFILYILKALHNSFPCFPDFNFIKWINTSDHVPTFTFFKFKLLFYLWP